MAFRVSQSNLYMKNIALGKVFTSKHVLGLIKPVIMAIVYVHSV